MKQLRCAVLALSLAAALPALAQSTDIRTGSQNGIAYASGGVGEEQQAAVKALRADYNLLMTFANKAGEYRAGVAVEASGKGAGFQMPDAGPLLYLKLPPGAWRISASSNGVTQTRNVSVPAKGASELAFTWD